MSIADIWRALRRGCRRAPAALRIWLAGICFDIGSAWIDLGCKLDTTPLPPGFAERVIERINAQSIHRIGDAMASEEAERALVSLMMKSDLRDKGL